MKKEKKTLVSRVLLLFVIMLYGSLGAAQQSGSPGTVQPTDSLLLNLEEVILQATFVREKQSPLRVTTIDSKSIEGKPIGYTYPQLIGNIPGVYATSETGSYGDARINIRGFQQENISVLLNGIPISGLVTGSMFWNNWLGLADATHAIQVQKGIGASMLSDNSVGGTINIITKTTQSRPGGSAGFFTTDYGQYKGFLSLNSGESHNGWAVSAMGSYTWGSGYPQATDVSSWAYMLNISKKIDSRHSLLFTALGSPERHQQRSARLTVEEVEKYGLDYNKNWGWHNGSKRNISENFYHKPYLTLQHFYKPSSSTELSSTLYLAVGDGGGNWTETKGQRILDFRKEGLIDWQAVVENNVQQGPSAVNIISKYLAGHTQSGFKTNFTKRREYWSFNSGLHYQYYYTWEKERITDLLGASYWYEDYENNSLAGLAGRNPIKKVGDYIRTHSGRITNHMTLYSSANFNNDRWDIRMGASLMGSTNQRWDKYNYINDIYSKVASGSGMSLKGGLSRKVNMAISIYANAAFYSRVPYSNLYFSSGNNNITSNVKNEHNILAEIGFRHLFQKGSVEVNLYYAKWKNKSIISNRYKQPDETFNRYMVTGLDALHTGAEITASYKPTRVIEVNAFIGIGDWKWKNDVSASIYDPYSGLLAQEINVYSKDLPVGDAPQTQLSVSVSVNALPNLQLNGEWSFNDRMYADFNPSDRQSIDDRSYSYKTPSYSLINADISWSPKIEGTNGEFIIFARAGNLLNQKYIERGRDGLGHDLESFSGFWGVPRNGSFGVRFTF